MVDFAQEPVLGGVRLWVRHNADADGVVPSRYHVYRLAGPPAVDQVPGSMKYGEPVLHPRATFELDSGWGGFFEDRCTSVRINDPDFADRWWIIEYEAAAGSHDPTHYTAMPFLGSWVPPFPGEFLPCGATP